MIIYVDHKNKNVTYIYDNATRLSMIEKEKELILEIKEKITWAKKIVSDDATNWYSQILLYDLEVYLLSCEYNLEKLTNKML